MEYWTLYYLTIVGWQYHPGNKEKLSLDDCAKVADEMAKHTQRREAWLTGQQPPHSAET